MYIVYRICHSPPSSLNGIETVFSLMLTLCIISCRLFIVYFVAYNKWLGKAGRGGLNSSFPIWENQAAPLNYKTLKIIYCVGI
jgi:hypothetical protein